MSSNKKKRLFIAGHTQQTCDSFEICVQEFLGDYIHVESWNLAQNPTLPKSFEHSDLVLVATIEIRDYLHKSYPNKTILVGERVLGAKNLDKLLSFKNDTRVYIVGSTDETTSNTLCLLKNLGLDGLDMVRCFPNMPQPLDRSIKIAITPGLLELVPAHIEQVINVGAKELSISAYADIIAHLGLPIRLLDKISNFYVKTILHNVRDIGIVGQQNATLKNRLETMLNTMQESIVSLDENSTVVAYNYAAEKIFGVPASKAMGMNWDDIYPDSLLKQCIDVGEDVTNTLKCIKQEHYLLTAKTIFDAEKNVRGVVGTFKLAEEIKKLDTQVRRELKTKANVAKYTFNDIQGNSEELKRAIALANKFAHTELTILLEGESGTGKELFAQAIHNKSARRTRPFLAINFAAIPDNLAESELFGYEEGAFTGARKGGKSGLFEEAHLGTIFLDEIGSASPDVQNRLLRVLEEHEIRRLGSGKNTPVDVRVIAASNIDLMELVQKKLFREDLYYRLCTLPIAIPPLRSRKGDVLELVNKFIHSRTNKVELSSEVIDLFIKYHWPGNIRELQNVVKYISTVVGHESLVSISDLPPYLLRENNITMFKEPAKQPTVSHQIVLPIEINLPAALNKPEIHSLFLSILQEIQLNTKDFRGLGYTSLLKKVRVHYPHASEYYIKKIMQILRDFGYAESGKTKQGTIITTKGEHLLVQLSKQKIK